MSHAITPTPDQVTLGIDISKDHLDVHLHPAGIAQRFTNDRQGHIKLIAWITPRAPTRIVFEATGALPFPPAPAGWAESEKRIRKPIPDHARG